MGVISSQTAPHLIPVSLLLRHRTTGFLLPTQALVYRLEARSQTSFHRLVLDLRTAPTSARSLQLELCRKILRSLLSLPLSLYLQARRLRELLATRLAQHIHRPHILGPVLFFLHRRN